MSVLSKLIGAAPRYARAEVLMPIYEFACPKCRKIFSFLSKRLNPDRTPVCPKCGNKKMAKQVSRFALTKGLKMRLAD